MKASGKSSIYKLVAKKLKLKLTLALVAIIVVVFLLNRIDFPAPKKEIEKIIPNENFKIVK